MGLHPPELGEGINPDEMPFEDDFISHAEDNERVKMIDESLYDSHELSDNLHRVNEMTMHDIWSLRSKLGKC